MSDSVPITGSCHCGNIRYTLRWPAGSPGIATRACGCTFCRKHGAAWTSHVDARLDFAISLPERSSRYRFGTATADFVVCSDCGVAPLVLSNIDGRRYAVVNVNTFDSDHGFELSQTATDFDAEDESSRLERRKHYWIASVAGD